MDIIIRLCFSVFRTFCISRPAPSFQTFLIYAFLSGALYASITVSYARFSSMLVRRFVLPVPSDYVVSSSLTHPSYIHSLKFLFFCASNLSLCACCVSLNLATDSNVINLPEVFMRATLQDANSAYIRTNSYYSSTVCTQRSETEARLYH